MSDKRIKTAVIGCGAIAPAHVECYLAIPGAELLGICDPQEDRMESIRSRYPENGLRCYTDYRELLEDADVDAVSVCTDHASHEEVVLAALAAGKHVICEKALTIDTGGLQRMVAASREAGRVAAGIFQHRFDSIYRALREIVQNGSLGKLLTISVQHNCYRSEEYYTADAWRGTWAGEGGSLLINQSIHFLDVVQWVMGGVQSVQAMTANQAHQGIIETEDCAAVSLAFPDGSLGTVTATSASHHTWENAFQVVGTDGELQLRNGRLQACFHKDEAAAAAIRDHLISLREEEGVEGAKVYYGPGHLMQLTDFVEAIREGRRPYVTLEDASHAVQLVLAIYESARTGQRVKL